MSSTKDSASKPKDYRRSSFQGDTCMQPPNGTNGNYQSTAATHATSRKSMPTGVNLNFHQRASISSGRPSPIALTSGTIGYQQSLCGYHNTVTNMQHGNHVRGYGLSPMNRYLNEGPSEQHAAFIRPDNGNFSLSRGCTCYVPLDEEHHTQRKA
ncbi:hypothetical protein MMC32_002314 [Xylographa parallela]|nr:hypothetical protein [Xylographa parallela]